MQGLTHTGSTGFTFRIREESGGLLGRRDAANLCDCDVLELEHISLHLGWQVT